MDIIKSINNVPIRLTEERWFHIVENHDDLSGYYDEVLNTVEDPEIIIRGYGDALIALKKKENKFLAVVYKELNKEDGFIIKLTLLQK
ncbi:MAG: hypothetical protein N2257_08445 [Thermodesulfovibrionales bacterium]|nr:hypothetical protein [Thermodesulfovibrionales bacterium]